MKILKHLEIVIAISLLLVATGCSSGFGKFPTLPQTGSQISDIPLPPENFENDRETIASCDVTIDPQSGNVTMEPALRIEAGRFPPNKYFPNCLKIIGFGFSPTFWVDIQLTHPFPGSGVDVFDPRVIAIIPAKAGYSMNYPGLYVQANNSVVLFPDGYTRLWDDPATPGNANPFLAYFKNQPYRRWSSTGVKTDTRRWYMDLSGFGGSMTYQLVVDVSTNYPAPPQPIIDNAPEPVNIDAMIGPGLTSTGGSTVMDVTLLDWQGVDGIGGVVVESPDLFNGFINLLYDGAGRNPNEYIFTGIIPNQRNAPAGTYHLLVATWDRVAGIAMYKEFKATVQNEPVFNPTDLTPPYLNYSPQDVFVAGSYAYVGGFVNGLHIFDISDADNPIWINRVPIPGYVYGLYVAGDYAYVTGSSQLAIVDINPPESAYIVKSVSLPSSPYDVYVSGNYAFVADYFSGLQIVDISIPASASVVKTVATSGQAWSVHVAGEFAYIADGTSGLYIIDVSPINTAQVVKIVDTGMAYGVWADSEYAYIADDFNGLQVIDINPPESAGIVKTVDTPGYSKNVQVSGNYAYVADEVAGLQIIDISNPLTAYILKTVNTPGHAFGIYKSGGYVYVADRDAGLQVVDILPPVDAHIQFSKDTPGSTAACYVDDIYAYVLNNPAQLQTLNIETPATTSYVNIVSTMDYVVDIEVRNSYAYVADGTKLTIYYIDPPESMTMVNSLDLVYAWDVALEGEYAYVSTGSLGGLKIVDIDPPESMSVVKAANHPGVTTKGIEISGGYAFLAAGTAGLDIYDIEPIVDAHLIKTVDTPDYAINLDVTGGYAYVADRNNGLQIIDVRPPESAYIIKAVNVYGFSDDVFLDNGYAYVATNDQGLAIVDAEPPQSAVVVKTHKTPGAPQDVFVNNEYAYISDLSGGFRIIKLW